MDGLYAMAEILKPWAGTIFLNGTHESEFEAVHATAVLAVLQPWLGESMLAMLPPQTVEDFRETDTVMRGIIDDREKSWSMLDASSRTSKLEALHTIPTLAPVKTHKRGRRKAVDHTL